MTHKPVTTPKGNPHQLHLSAAKILAHYEEIIRGLERPPIMGHSFGGTFAQIMIDRGLGAAGVSIDGATLRGIPDLPLSTLRSTAHVLSDWATEHAGHNQAVTA